jgi:hypothetical protein
MKKDDFDNVVENIRKLESEHIQLRERLDRANATLMTIQSLAYSIAECNSVVDPAELVRHCLRLQKE